jgi:hypothetical protein
MMTAIKTLSFLLYPLVAIEFGYLAARRRFLLRRRDAVKGGAA